MRTAVTLFLVAGLAAPLAAQQHEHGAQSDSAQGTDMSCQMMERSATMDGMQMGGMKGNDSTGMMGGDRMGMMDGGNMGMMSAPRTMMAGMRFMPDRVLGLADSLGLTEQQVAQIREIKDSMEPQEGHEAMHERFEALEQALEAEEPNPEAVQAAAEAALTMRAQMQARRLAAMTAVRAVLTDEQRDRLEASGGCSMSGSQEGMHEGGGMEGARKQL